MSRKPKKAVIPSKEIFLKDLPINRQTRNFLKELSKRLHRPPELIVARLVHSMLMEIKGGSRKQKRDMLNALVNIIRSRK